MEMSQQCCPVPSGCGEDAQGLFDVQMTKGTCAGREGPACGQKAPRRLLINQKDSLVLAKGSHCSGPASGTMGWNKEVGEAGVS